MEPRRASARLSAIAESATLKVDARAKALRAQGRNVIGFGAGEPDFATPAHIVEAAKAACEDPASHKYTPAGGLPALKQTVADKHGVQPGNVLITNGGKHAVFAACAAILDDGDEVLLPAPYWTTYPESIKLAGATPVEVLAGQDQGFLVSVDQLEAARTEKTRALVLCSPSNPTGAVYPEDAMRAVAAWALEHGIWIVFDEIYDELLYDGAQAPSPVALVPEVADTTLVVGGIAKTYAMTGWRVGWVVGPEDVVKAATSFQSHATSNVANVSQRAALAALTGPREPVEEMHAAFARRRATMLRMLRDIPGVEVLDPMGAFYCFPSVRGVLGCTVAGRKTTTSADLAEVLLDEAEVAVVPGEAFGAPGYLRLSYALAEDAIVDGLTRFKELLTR